MHDVACEFARAVVRSKDAQKQFARTSLIHKNVKHIVFFIVRERYFLLVLLRCC